VPGTRARQLAGKQTPSLACTDDQHALHCSVVSSHHAQLLESSAVQEPCTGREPRKEEQVDNEDGARNDWQQSRAPCEREQSRSARQSRSDKSSYICGTNVTPASGTDAECI